MVLVIPDVLEESCSTRQALERFSAKWRVLLIYALLAGPQRHAQLRRRLPGISQKVLTETLRGMEADGLVRRRVVKAERAAARRVRADRPRAHAGETARGDLRLGDQPAALSLTAPGA